MPTTLGTLVVLVALGGLVVNTSLVLVDYVNQHRQANRSVITVVKEAGARRFRPIMLTALTTVFGLVPILIEEGIVATRIKPFTVPLAFGVAFSTLVTLFVVPLCYAALEDVRGWRRFGRRSEDAEGSKAGDNSLGELPVHTEPTNRRN